MTETNTGDFANSGGATRYYRIQLPTGFQFTAIGGVTGSALGGDFANVTITNATTYIQLNIATQGTSEINSFTISGYQVAATITSPTSGDIIRVDSPSGTDLVVNGSPFGAIHGTLSKEVAPSISSQPVSPTVCENESTTLSVSATGGSFTYQWQRDAGSGFVNIDLSTDGGIYSNFNSSTLNINSSPISIDGYDYQVVITGACLPIATSNTATITVDPLPSAPNVTDQSQTVCLNEAISAPVASGSGGTFEWYSDASLSTNIFTGTNPTLANIGFDNTVAGVTTVYVTETSSPNNCEGPATTVTLTVNPLPDPSLAVSVSDASETCTGGTLDFTISNSQAGVNYQLFDESNTAISNLVGGNGTSLSITSYVLNFATYSVPEDITVKAINASTLCESDLTDVETITISDQPTTANAGTDIDQCATAAFTLAGNNPSVGTGLWTVTAGTATITSPTAFNSGVTGVTAGTSATLRWTISNGSCADSFDEVVLTNFASPSAADAGVNITQCNTSTFTMAAINPTTGTGAWSLQSGTATITNTASNTTTVTGIAAGTAAVVRWTVSNGNCADTFEDITLTNDQMPTTANAGTDIDQCATAAFTLAGNNPTVGTGLWTVTAGTATITSAGLNNSGVTGVPAGSSATLRWTISNGSCTDSFDEVTLTNYAAPSAADAGIDITQCNNATFTMAAVTPTTGTGSWSIQSGPGTITNTASATTTVTGVTAGLPNTVIRWTVSNGTCADTFEDITLTNDALPTTANAGPDLENCASGNFTLAGNNPTTGTGNWTVTSGTATITSAGLNNSGVTGVPAGSSATLRWTISNGSCTDSFDEVTLTNYAAPSAADAGIDITQCNNATFTMAAVTPTTGTGSWSIQSGPGTITNTASATTTVTGVTAGLPNTVIRWTVSNGTCADTFEDITLTNDALPTTANAGPDLENCASGNFTLAGNNPTTGTGNWTVTSGTATITSAGLNNSGVTGVPAGSSATLRWTISNGSCTDSFDEVTLTNYAAPSAADAGIDITQCNNATFTMAAVTPTTGTGSWSIQSGPGTITNTASATTTVTGVTAGLPNTVIRWTVSNGTCADTFEDITLTNDALPTTANAGPDLENCASGNFTLAGNNPTTGTGNWTVTSGTATITSAGLNNSGVTGVPAGSSATLRWTISNGSCTDSFDEVTLTNYAAPSAADAGIDITQCNNATFTMAAVTPTTGTGSWSIQSGPGTITNTASATTTVTGVTAGLPNTVIRWTVSNGTCADTFEDITLTNDALPTTANAGPDLENCASGNFTLAGNNPTTGTGNWTVTSGTATITSAGLNNSGVTGVPAGSSATLRWTISNGSCTDSFDEVTLTNYAAPSAADAGIDITQCNNATFTMAAVTPTTGTGSWSIQSGPGTITNTASATTTVTGVTAGLPNTVIRWTVSNGTCADTFEDITLTNDALPTTANAGPDLENCASGNFTLAGNNPTTGTGNWTVTSGTATITSAGLNNSGVTGVPAGSSATLRWTISNGSCTDSFDEVTLTNYAAPSAADAGIDITQCNNATFTMAAVTPTTGTGSWSIQSGPGTITNTASATTTVTGVTAGLPNTVIRWTVSNGTCADTFEDITLTNDALPTTANAGPDLENCASGNFTLAGNNPTTGTGNWTVTSGTATITSAGLNNSGVTGVPAGSSATLRWTISNGSCTDSFDEVTLTNYAAPSAADAGIDITQCNNATFTMAAVTPTTGTGSWSIQSGPGTITNTASATTTVTGVTAGLPNTVIRWTVSNGTCADTFEDITLTNDALPTTANAGPDLENCASGNFTLAGNNPTTGTGNWTVTSGTATITSAGLNNSGVTGVPAGSSATLRWTISNGSCTDSFDEVTLTNYAAPSAADAGIDITQCNNATFTMAAVTPTTGTGSWSIQSGPGTITNTASATTTVTGVTAGLPNTVIRWTVSNGTCADTFEDITLTNDALPTTANAGPDLENCASGNFTLAGNNPTTGTGNWTVTSGTATITSAGLNNSAVTGVPAGSSATLRWTISNGSCTDSFDEVTLTNYAAPSAADAGIDITQCNNATFTMAAVTPTTGTGSWSIQSGPGTITNTASATTTVTGVTAGLPNTVIRWTVSNGTCADTFEDITLTNDALPTTANAGPDLENCASGNFTLAGNNPTTGTGNWTVTSGTATITSAGLNNSGVTGVPAGSSATLRWTISNGSCTDSFDEVTLTNYAAPSAADAGIDITQCNNATFTMAAVTPTTGTGSWSIQSGPGTITNTASATTTVTGVTAGLPNTVIRWTVSNGTCADTFEDITLTNDALPTTANAGPDLENCASGNFTLAGNNPTTGTGNWTVTSGTATITSAGLNNSGVTGVPAGSSATLRWTISNGSCTDSFDEVTLTNYAAPSAADAGIDITQCNNATFTMAAVTPTTGTGSWSIQSGPGTITNTASATTTVTGVTAGLPNTVIRWTVSNGTCADTFEDITLTNDALPTTANAGPDLENCASGNFTLAGNNPTTGTGNWTVTSGTATITSAGLNNSGVTGVPAGSSATLRWTISNGSCTDSFDEVTLTNYAAPSAADAGIDITQCNNATFTMAAVTPTTGTGSWSIQSGPGTITNTASATTTVTGVTAGLPNTVIRWTVSNGTCADTFEDITLTNDALPTTANAGPDLENCASGNFTLAGNNPTTGTGNWTVTSGTATITSAGLNNSGVTGVPAGSSATLRWTISNGSCTDSFDEVTLTNYAAPSAADAGIDITQCNNATFTMAAVTPTTGTGSWSIQSGPGTITNTASATTTVTGVTAGLPNTVIRWTVSNGTCADTFEDITLTNDALPTTANAGPDLENCASGNFTLAGNNPTTGTGNWTVTSGTATITSAGLNNSGVTGVPAGSSATLRWTISNGSCTDSFDEVTLTNYAAPSAADAGIDITQCNNATFTMAAVTPTTGTGSWSIQSGPGTITNTASATTTVTGVTAGLPNTVIRWTVSNGTCADTFEDITLTNDALPTTANAGPDLENCASGNFTLAGNNPTTGTGNWTVTSGTATITSAGLNNSGVTGVPAGSSATLRWTISNGSCTDSFDEVTLTNYAAPSAADAGIDITQCNNATFTMAAVTPTTGTGSWSIQSGPGTITNTASATTTVTGVTAGLPNTVIRWTVSNGTCADTFEDITLTNDALPTTANAGPDLENCASGNFTLAGNNPTTGTGNWTVTSGTATITSAGLNNSGVTGVPAGSSATLRWTISNGSCTDSFDEVTLTNYAAPSAADAGIDITQCNNATFTMAAVTPTTGTGSWSIQSGPGTITNTASATTTVTGVTAGLPNTVIRWTVSNGTCADTFEDITLTNDALPTTANAGPDLENCASGNFTLAGNNPTTGTGNWTVTSGTATITSAGLNNSGVTGVPAGSSATLRWTISNGSCTDSFDEVVLTNFASPVFSPVPADIEACAGELINLNFTTASGADNITWTADNTSVGNPTNGTNTLNFLTSANNTTSDIITTITVSATNSACTTPVTTSFTITLHPTPDILNFFPPVEVCENEAAVDLNSLGLAANIAGGSFSFTGPGVSGTSFDATSVSLGVQEIDVTYTTIDGCSKTESINLLNVIAEPTADAGAATDELCENTAYTVSDASATNSAGILWTHDGSGSITNATTLTPTYTPINADAGSTVTLTLTVDGFSACADAIDTKVLTITAEPVANAGSDSEVCASETSFDMSTATTIASASQFNTITWTSSGTGTFDNNNAITPIYTPSAADKTAGTVTLTLTATGNGSCATVDDDMVLTITPVPVANAGSDSEVCASETSFDMSTATTIASASQFNTITWTSSGTGTFDNDNAITPIYTPSAADKTAGTVTLTLTATGNGSCATVDDDMVLTISPVPVANAGSDSEVCASETSFDMSTATTIASASQFNTITWTSSGTGTFDNDNAITPIYTPSAADKTAGTVTLTLTATGNGSCATVDDDMVLTITPVPVANAGSDSEVCASETSFDMSTATTIASASQFNTITWTSSGTGTFDNDNAITPIYTPSAADKTAGTVTLTLTATGNGSCATVDDDMVLTITPVPVANAGSDSEVCASETSFDMSTATTIASASQFNTITWTSSGTGTFDNDNAITPIYTPSAADKTAGTVTLTLTATGNGSCATVDDDMVLTITPVPVANAGSDSEVCASETSFDMSTATTIASASQFNTITWTSSGTGTFDNDNAITPIYTPSAADKTAGTVTLTLTATGNGSCATVDDDMVLTITPVPVANAGSDSEVCASETSFDMSTATTIASASQFNTITWTSSGTGTFDNDNAITPIYTPSAADKTAGTVTLTLTATGNGSCATVDDDMVLTITPVPVANAGSDSEVCASETSFDMSTATTIASASQFNTITWTSSGTGTFDNDNAITPIYTPSAADKTAGTVTLTLTATGNGSCATVDDDMVLTITPVPVANAGSDSEVCASETSFDMSTATTIASASQFNTITWTSSGTGTFDNDNAITPIYTPSAADKTAGTVTLTLTATGNGSCATVDDDMVLTITPVPVANAGSDSEVCASETSFDMSTATTIASASQFNTITWTSSGTGTFDNDNAITPIYTPSAADKTAGTVTLTLTATGNGSCATVDDDMVLTITPVPVANAGSDSEVCASETSFDMSTATTIASASQFNTITWTSSGTGTFDNDNAITPIYTPSAADKTAGTVTLTLTATGNGSCATVDDDMVLTITPVPVANAGSDSEVCASETSFDMSTATTIASASQFNTITWTSSGTGTFDNDNAITPIYTPSAADKTAGTVTLTLTATGNGSCATVDDDMVLTISPLPVATITTGGSEVCISEPITLSGTVNSGASAGLWIIQTGQGAAAENSGTLSGTSNNAGTYEAVFTPDGSYFGNVNFEFIAQSNSSCSDDIAIEVITIRSLPTVIDRAYTLCEDSQGTGNSIVDLTTYNGDVTSENLANVTIDWFTNSSLTNPVSNENAETIFNNTSYYARVTLNATNCFDRAQVDFTVDPQIVLEAGSNEAICDGDVLDLSTITTPPSESNATTLLWTTSGDGSFNNANAISPIYTPGPTDLANSPITLTLTGSSVGPCSNVVDQLDLTIKPVAIIDPIANVSLCPSDNQSIITFSADIAGGSFSWTATNSAQLGLAPTGTGDFPAFTAQANNTGSSIISTVTVDYLLNGCLSISESFDIEVKPTPVTDNIIDISVCPGGTVNINFNANTTGETFNWSNDNNAIGVVLASNGTGDISFTAESNNTGSIISSNFTYSATLNGCTSIVKNFTVNLLPQPIIDPIGDIELCSFENILTSFNSNVSGSTFSWTNDNTGTGIPAAGTGNINVNAVENLTGADLVSNITVTATKDGCVSTVETFIVTVKPKPILNPQATIEICSGDNIASIVLSDNSSGASTINWTATNAAAIGLTTSSGTGNIPAFTANINNTTSAIVSNVTVTSTWNGCVSDQQNFQIRLKPTPIMNAIADAQRCGGENFSVTFGNSLGASTSYAWTNDNTAIGLAANGTGNISFTTDINNTGAAIVANITVTPTNNGCVGPDETFEIRLNPTPVISSLPDINLCSNEFISIPFTIDLSSPNLNVSIDDNSLITGSPVLNGSNIEFTTALNASGADLSAVISLTATKDGCSSTETFTLTLKSKPQTAAIADRAAVCPGDNILGQSFTYTDGNPSGTFTWTITNPSIIGDPSTMPTSGNGDLPTFVAASNNTGAPIESDIVYFSTRNGCISDSRSFKVIIKPAPFIAMPDVTLCPGEQANILFEDNLAGTTNYIWTNDNTTIGITSNSGSTNDFITNTDFIARNDSRTEDNIAIISVYGVNDGCTGEIATFRIIVKPDPEINIAYTNICDIDNGVALDFTSSYSDLNIQSYEWTVPDNPSLLIENDTVIFNSPGRKEIRLEVITTDGCTFINDFTIDVGNIDLVNFAVSNASTSQPGDPGTQFSERVNSTSTIVAYSWDFGDPNTNADVSTEANPTYNYVDAGTYSVTLTVTDEFGCSESVVRDINIIPTVSDLPYFENFDASSGGWVAESLGSGNNSWIYSVQNTAFNNNRNQTEFWHTINDNNEAGFQENEESSLKGPTFRINTLERPMLSFDLYLDFNDLDADAGAVVEYSISEGEWEILYNPNGNTLTEGEELNWYNGTTTNSLGGNNPLELAWIDESNRSDDLNQTSWNWVRVARDLSALQDAIGNNSVTFRITIRGNDYDITETDPNKRPLGVAIDNFYLGENTNVALLESFTSLNNSAAYTNQKSAVDSIKNAFTENVLNIQYHINDPDGGDLLYKRYPVGLNTRAATYNINDKPQIVLDGNALYNKDGSTPEDLFKRVRSRTLLAPDNAMTINIDNTADQNTVRFNSIIEVNQKLDTLEVAAYYFVIEKSITIDVDGSPITLNNIVRTALPSINGEFISAGLNTQFSNTYEWTVNNIYAGSELAIVGVIQNVKTNEIIEAKLVDITQAKANIQVLSNMSAFDIAKIDVFPIPAVDKLNIHFERSTDEDLDYLVFDVNGRIVMSGKILSGTKEHSLSVQGNYPGMYHLILKDKKGNISTKKIMIK